MTNKNFPPGKRILALREQLNLSRQDFDQQTGVSANTLKSFELGARELPTQKARQLSYVFTNLFTQILGKESYETSFDWIYYGKKPKWLKELEKSVTYFNTNIQEEIHALIKDPSYSVLNVQDSLMSPHYRKGDIVAGQVITIENQFPLCEGRICILKTLKDEFLLRKVIKCRNRKITTGILNDPATKNTPLAREDIEVQSIAQATKHWRLPEKAPSPSTPKASRQRTQRITTKKKT